MFNPGLDRGDDRLPMRVLVGFLIGEAKARGDLPEGCDFDVEIKHQPGCSVVATNVCDCQAEIVAVFYPKERA